VEVRAEISGGGLRRRCEVQVEVMLGGVHLLFNCFLMGLLGSSQRCKTLTKRL
jgi:hypothetical protein